VLALVMLRIIKRVLRSVKRIGANCMYTLLPTTTSPLQLDWFHPLWVSLVLVIHFVLNFLFFKITLFHLIVMSMTTNWISLVVAGQYLCGLLMASVFSVL
jgi:hypothetical protein